VDSLLRRIARSGFRRVMGGEHWAWGALALAAFVLRRARRPVDDTVSVRVRRGERYVVSLTGPQDATDAVELV
jgi:MYXO-CTERM domain-containing protein